LGPLGCSGRSSFNAAQAGLEPRNDLLKRQPMTLKIDNQVFHDHFKVAVSRERD
jgi:hypothetical protein